MSDLRKYIIVSLLITTGCGGFVDEKGNHQAFTPAPLLIRNLPTGDDDYSQGFRDGCNDYIGIAGFGGQRLMDSSTFPTALVTSNDNMKYRYDPNKALHNELYALGMKHGGNYCGIAANAAVGY
jgi:hypothetical protein